MRWNGCLISIALAALTSAAAPALAASFGTVVPIGGHASDIALDEARGVLYIANFTANRIEVMNTADYSIHSSMNVAPEPQLDHGDQPGGQHPPDLHHRRHAAGGGVPDGHVLSFGHSADRDHDELP